MEGGGSAYREHGEHTGLLMAPWRLSPPMLASRRMSSAHPQEKRHAPQVPAHGHNMDATSRAPRDARWPRWRGRLAGLAPAAARHGPERDPCRANDLGDAFHPDPDVV